MLKQLSKYFDHYTIQARFMPAFFTLLPIVVSILVWCPNAKTALGGSLTILISFGVMTLLSTLISNIGNKCQEHLFCSWGGAPTTLILRHSNEVIDKYTKQRYHSWLNKKIRKLNLPSQSNETINPVDADLKYQSAINFLRKFTRDKQKYPAVYRDNIAYGFSRNLLAMKGVGVSLSIFNIVINTSILWFLFERNLFSQGVSTAFGIGGILASLSSLLVLHFLINEDFVKRRGFRYAKSLLETCEKSH